MICPCPVMGMESAVSRWNASLSDYHMHRRCIHRTFRRRRHGSPAQAVIVPSADVGMFSFRIGRLLSTRLTEYVAGALQLSSIRSMCRDRLPSSSYRKVSVSLAGQFSPLTLPRLFVTVLHCIAVTVYSPADLPCRSVLIAFLPPVRKANACDASPTVHVIGRWDSVAVHNSRDRPLALYSYCWEGTLMVP